MSINKTLMEELCRKMNIKKSRFYQKIKEVQNTQFVSKEKAAYILAYQCGIPITSYLDDAELEEIGNFMKNINLGSDKRTHKEEAKKEIKIMLYSEKAFKEIKEPLLPENMISDAKKMTQYYPYFYILENSIRNLIIIVMTKKYGKNWWRIEIENNNNFKKLCQKVDDRKKPEDKIKWHGKRNAHEIFYVDVDDLKKIVIDYWAYYKNILPDRPWFETTLNIINMSRRVIAHNNPLSERDFKRIKVICQDWCDQMKLAKEKLGV